MNSVVGRIKEVKQPRGGYIKPSSFICTHIEDGRILSDKENVSASIIGMAVDYLTRFCIGTKREKAFEISLKGAKNAREQIEAEQLLHSIKGLDDESIIAACKLVSFDVWYRNPVNAIRCESYEEIYPDKDTISNIRTLVERSLAFVEMHGPITKDSFTFEPESTNMHRNSWEDFGGYSATVTAGDGDFLTEDTLWDFKVSKSKPTSKHTLQVLMYWIMGQHSEKKEFKNITKIGIFNPRLNNVYLLSVTDIPQETIRIVERDVIEYANCK